MDTGLKTKFNYQTRLFFLIIVFTWILTFAFFTLQYTREKEYKVDTLNTELQMMNLKILYNIESHGYHIDEDFINDISALDSVRVTVIGLDGDVKYDNSHDGSAMENHIGRMEIREALDKGEGYTIRRRSETDRNEYFYSATRGDSLVVRTALPYSKALADYFQVDSVYMWVIILSLLWLLILEIVKRCVIRWDKKEN